MLEYGPFFFFDDLLLGVLAGELFYHPDFITLLEFSYLVLCKYGVLL